MADVDKTMVASDSSSKDVDLSKLYVNSEWTNYKEGDAIADREGLYFGINAFKTYTAALQYVKTWSDKRAVSTIYIEKSDTKYNAGYVVSATEEAIIGGKYPVYTGVETTIEDGARLDLMVNNLKINYVLTVEAGGSLNTTRGNVSTAYLQSGGKLIAGEAGGERTTVNLMNGTSTTRGYDLLTTWGNSPVGTIEVANTDFTVRDLGLNSGGTAKFTDDSLVTIQGALSANAQMTVTDSTVNVWGTHGTTNSTYFKLYNYLGSLVMTNSTMTIGDNNANTVTDKVVIKTVTLTDSDISVADDAAVSVEGTFKLLEGSSMKAGNVNFTKGSFTVTGKSSVDVATLNIASGLKLALDSSSVLKLDALTGEGLIEINVVDGFAGVQSIVDFANDDATEAMLEKISVKQDGYSLLLQNGDIYLAAPVYVFDDKAKAPAGIPAEDIFDNIADAVEYAGQRGIVVSGRFIDVDQDTIDALESANVSFAEGTLFFLAEGVTTTLENANLTVNAFVVAAELVEGKVDLSADNAVAGTLASDDDIEISTGEVSEGSAEIRGSVSGKDIIVDNSKTLAVTGSVTGSSVVINNADNAVLNGGSDDYAAQFKADDTITFVNNGHAAVDMAAKTVEIKNNSTNTLTNSTLGYEDDVIVADTVVIDTDLNAEGVVTDSKVGAKESVTIENQTVPGTEFDTATLNIYGTSVLGDGNSYDVQKFEFGSLTESVDAQMDVTNLTSGSIAVQNGTLTMVGQMAETALLHPVLPGGMLGNPVRGDMSSPSGTINIGDADNTDAYVRVQQIQIGEDEAENEHTLNVYGKLDVSASIYNKSKGNLNIYNDVNIFTYLQAAGDTLVSGSDVDLKVNTGNWSTGTYGLKIGGKNGYMSQFTIDNGASVEVTGEVYVGHSTNRNGNLIIQGGGSLTAGSLLLQSGSSITIDADGFTGGVYHALDLSMSKEAAEAIQSAITITNVADGVEVLKLDDGDVMFVKVDKSTLYVDQTYSGKFGADLGDGKYFGINAFASFDEIADKIQTDGSATTVNLSGDADGVLTIGKVVDFVYGDGDITFTADEAVTVKQTVLGSELAFDEANDITVKVDQNVTFEIYDNAAGMYMYYGPSLELHGTITGGQNWGCLHLFNGTHTVYSTGELSTGRIHLGYTDLTVNGGNIDTNYLLVEGSTFTATGATIDANVIYDNHNGSQRWGESEFYITDSTVNSSKVTVSYADSIFELSGGSLSAGEVVNNGKFTVAGETELNIATANGNKAITFADGAVLTSQTGASFNAKKHYLNGVTFGSGAFNFGGAAYATKGELALTAGAEVTAASTFAIYDGASASIDADATLAASSLYWNGGNIEVNGTLKAIAGNDGGLILNAAGDTLTVNNGGVLDVSYVDIYYSTGNATVNIAGGEAKVGFKLYDGSGKFTWNITGNGSLDVQKNGIIIGNKDSSINVTGGTLTATSITNAGTITVEAGSSLSVNGTLSIGAYLNISGLTANTEYWFNIDGVKFTPIADDYGNIRLFTTALTNVEKGVTLMNMTDATTVDTTVTVTNGSLKVNVDSEVEFATLDAAAESITVDTTGYTDGTKRILNNKGADLTKADYEAVVKGDAALDATVGEDGKFIVANGDLYLTDAKQDVLYVNSTYTEDSAYADGKILGYNAFTSLSGALEAKNNTTEKIIVNTDITDDLSDGISGKIVATEGRKVTITNTDTGYLYTSNVELGKGITLATPSIYVYETNSIAADLVVDSTFYSSGKLELTGTATIAGNVISRRYETAEDGIYIIGTAATGEGKNAVSQMDAEGYLGHYSGTLSILNSAAEFGYLNLEDDSIDDPAGTYPQATVKLNNALLKTTGFHGGPGHVLMNDDTVIIATNDSVLDFRGLKEQGYLNMMSKDNSITLIDSAMYLGDGTSAGCAASTVAGSIILTNSTLNSKGAITNNGTITVNGGTFTAATVTNNGTFTVSGTSSISGDFTQAVISASGATINTNGLTDDALIAGVTYGAGNFTITGTVGAGTVDVSAGTTMIIDSADLTEALIFDDAAAEITVNKISYTGSLNRNGVTIVDGVDNAASVVTINGVEYTIGEAAGEDGVSVKWNGDALVASKVLDVVPDENIPVTDADSSWYYGGDAVTTDTASSSIATETKTLNVALTENNEEGGRYFGGSSISGEVEASYYSRNTEVNVSGMGIQNGVYGGNFIAEGADVKSSFSDSTVNITATQGAAFENLIVGGNRVNDSAFVTLRGTSSVSISGAEDATYKDHVIGGSLASGTGAVAENDNTSVTIACGIFSGNIYGGGYAQRSATVTVENASVTINGGTFSGKIYGGNGAASAQENTVAETTSVTINGGTFNGNIYGGSFGLGRVDVSSTVTINGGTFGDIVIDGDSSNAEFYKKDAVADRNLIFNGYDAALEANIRNFDTVKFLNDSDIDMTNGTFDAAEVDVWSFENGASIKGLGDVAFDSEDTLEIYLKEFAADVTGGDSWTIMTGSSIDITELDNVIANIDGSLAYFQKSGEVWQYSDYTLSLEDGETEDSLVVVKKGSIA